MPGVLSVKLRLMLQRLKHSSCNGERLNQKTEVGPIASNRYFSLPLFIPLLPPRLSFNMDMSSHTCDDHDYMSLFPISQSLCATHKCLLSIVQDCEAISMLVSSTGSEDNEQLYSF